MNSRNRNIEEFFQKLTDEADNWPVEYLTLTDDDDRWLGLFFIDRHLDDSKKKLLGSTIDRLSDTHNAYKEAGPEQEQACAVSAEERTLLFNFLHPSSRDD